LLRGNKIKIEDSGKAKYFKDCCHLVDHSLTGEILTLQFDTSVKNINLLNDLLDINIDKSLMGKWKLNLVVKTNNEQYRPDSITDGVYYLLNEDYTVDVFHKRKSGGKSKFKYNLTWLLHDSLLIISNSNDIRLNGKIEQLSTNEMVWIVQNGGEKRYYFVRPKND
jgi:hypothetical protein